MWIEANKIMVFNMHFKYINIGWGAASPPPPHHVQ